VSEAELSRLDDLEADLPDIPDFPDAPDAPDPDAPAAGSERGVAASDDPAEGAAARSGRLAAVAGLAGPLLAPLGRPFGALARASAPLASRVPPAALAGALGFAGVLVVILLGASLLGGGKAAEASLAVESRPTPRVAVAAPQSVEPVIVPSPASPALTPTPTTFQPLGEGEGWLALGTFSPEPRHILPAGRMLLFDDEREAFTVRTSLSVLLQSGPLAPWWGILLSYQGEQEHTRIEFFTDSYDRNRPYVSLFTTRNGPSKGNGPTVRLPNIDFWGRDRYEVRVTVDREDVRLWIGDQPIRAWKVPGGVPSGRKGLYVWGKSRLQFDAFSVE
jgi:hypothetical protein